MEAVPYGNMVRIDKTNQGIGMFDWIGTTTVNVLANRETHRKPEESTSQTHRNASVHS